MHVKIEQPLGSALTFAYVYRDGEDETTAPPMKEFHTLLLGEDARRLLMDRAELWIKQCTQK